MDSTKPEATKLKRLRLLRAAIWFGIVVPTHLLSEYNCHRTLIVRLPYSFCKSCQTALLLGRQRPTRDKYNCRFRSRGTHDGDMLAGGQVGAYRLLQLCANDEGSLRILSAGHITTHNLCNQSEE